MGILTTIDHIQTKIELPNFSQEPPASSKAPNWNLKDMDVLCTFKIKIESQNLDYGFIKDQRPYPNQDAKPQSGSCSILQSPKWGHGCSLHLQNPDREHKFGSWVCGKSVSISKLRAWCQTQVRNLQYPAKPKIRTWRTWMFFAPSKSS